MLIPQEHRALSPTNAFSLYIKEEKPSSCCGNKLRRISLLGKNRNRSRCSITVDDIYIAFHGQCPMYIFVNSALLPSRHWPHLLPFPHAFFIFGRKLLTERQNRKRVKNHLYEMQHDSAEKETMLLLLRGLRRCASGS